MDNGFRLLILLGKKMTKDPLMVQRFSEVWKILKKESTRGSVIVASAVIEDELQGLLKGRLVLCSEDNDLLFEGANSPVGTFSSKIELAYRKSMGSDSIDFID